MAATVKVIRSPRGIREQVYLIEILRGLGVTLRHLFVNVLLRRETTTVQYPEQKVRYPERFRGLHRLMKREDGRVRCVACMMCSTACPSRCIHIEAAETDDPAIEKYPAVFEINELLCVDCGLCVDACPCDAIRMDTGIHPPPVLHRKQALLTKEDLLQRGERSISVQGGEGPDWRRHT